MSQSACLGIARQTVKKAREILTGREASLRQYNGGDSNVPSLVLTQRFIQRPWNAANKSPSKKETLQVIRRVLPIRQDIAYSFCFTGAETEIHKIKDDSKIDREKNIHRRGPRQIGTDWHISDPPTFWLPTTFNQ